MENLTQQQACRFLDLATMGVKQSEVTYLLSLDDRGQWINEQIAQPYMDHLQQTRYQAHSRNLSASTQDCRVGAWFDIALNDNAQLRQRVAFALSQIFVVSEKDSNLIQNADALANFYQLLTQGAFVSFKDLLRDITLSPVMGLYLTMNGNKPQSITGQAPDQNYAREVMQLFTIGLHQLNMDGSFVLDEQGKPQETYQDSDIEALARVFTGWDVDNSNTLVPMVADETQHDTNTKYILNQTYPQGQTARQDLEQFLEQISSHPNVAPFISTLLIKRLTTSNPSREYVYRVANIFYNSDGNLAEVIHAIYTDRALFDTPSHHMAKVREPILAMTYLYRALHAYPGGGNDIIYDPMSYKETFNQYPLGANSVFNFYSPNHMPPGDLTQKSLTAPELAIIDWGQLINMGNIFYRCLRDYGQNRGNSSNKKELYVAPAALEDLAQSGQGEQLLDTINLWVLNAQGSPEVLARLQNIYNGHNNKFYAVHKMLFLAFISPDFMVQE
ncbi:hypothetical protein BS333_13620 [Vibrio azureus]|uniref:DUF1800 domain-containing protein n=1 Tax=Vibrio azureus NBRC 104587 TaxID=1219077 RepID=U3AUS7_9VIBR|nr:DUF1800 family protein [Vibrio azureus]AUI87308.1 hypothetical protein BS333_13620 [Vibrio azureus]GAD77510.1 hypothetical protein VAZ01S_078_00170 [Vibrio azureus NBRC 104587]